MQPGCEFQNNLPGDLVNLILLGGVPRHAAITWMLEDFPAAKFFSQGNNTRWLLCKVHFLNVLKKQHLRNFSSAQLKKSKRNSV